MGRERMVIILDLSWIKGFCGLFWCGILRCACIVIIPVVI